MLCLAINGQSIDEAREAVCVLDQEERQRGCLVPGRRVSLVPSECAFERTKAP